MPLLLCLVREEAAVVLLPYIKGLFWACWDREAELRKEVVAAADVLYLVLTRRLLA